QHNESRPSGRLFFVGATAPHVTPSLTESGKPQGARVNWATSAISAREEGKTRSPAAIWRLPPPPPHPAPAAARTCGGPRSPAQCPPPPAARLLARARSARR